MGEGKKPLDESGHFEGYEDGVLRVDLGDCPSGQAFTIASEIFPDALKLFFQKNRDYGATSFDLGAAGQFAEIWRKVGKLKGPMWEGKSLEFEQADEILKDLIGHCLLSLYFLRDERLKAGREKDFTIQKCEWFALCENDAFNLAKGPGGIYVPICDRCKNKMERIG